VCNTPSTRDMTHSHMTIMSVSIPSISHEDRFLLYEYVCFHVFCGAVRCGSLYSRRVCWCVVPPHLLDLSSSTLFSPPHCISLSRTLDHSFILSPSRARSLFLSSPLSLPPSLPPSLPCSLLLFLHECMFALALFCLCVCGKCVCVCVCSFLLIELAFFLFPQLGFYETFSMCVRACLCA